MLMWFGEVPIPMLFADYLKYDPGDVPAVVATYSVGPAAGLGVGLCLVKRVLARSAAYEEASVYGQNL